MFHRRQFGRFVPGARSGRPQRLRRRTTATLVAVALMSLGLSALPIPARAAITPAATAGQIGTAIAGPTSGFTTASFLTKPPNGTPDAVADQNTSLGGFPTDGSTYGILSSGDAGIGSQPNASGSSGTDDGGTPANTPSRGNTAYDVSTLRVNFTVPNGVNCLQVDFRFLSEEFPEYVGTQYNDGFIAELDTSDWTTNGSNIVSPHNFAFDPNGDIISINSTGPTHMSAGEAAGTSYDGASPGLIAQTPVLTSGPHSVYFSIFDQGDAAYDSAVFLDNLTLGTAASGLCVAGAKPIFSGLSLSVSPQTSPAGFSDTSTDDVDRTALVSQPNGNQDSLATAPIGHSPIGHSPIGHSPIGHSPIGHSPLGADSPFRNAPLSDLPLSSVPPIPLSSVFTPNGWDAELQGTSLANQPIQLLTLQQVANLASPPVGLGDVDLANTVLSSLSAASFLFGNTSFSTLGIAAPSGSLASDTLAKAELGGASLASLNVGNVALKGKLSPRSPLLDLSLDGIDLSLTPLRSVSTSALGALLACPGTCPATLEDAESADAIAGSATVGSLLAVSGVPAIDNLTLGQLMPGIVDSAYVNYGAIPQGQILDASPLTGPYVTYTASVTALCQVADTAHVVVKLPNARFRYLTDSAYFPAIEGESPPAPNPSVSGNALDWAFPASSCSDGQLSSSVQIAFQAEPAPDVGTFTSTLVAKTDATGGLVASKGNLAPLTLTDPLEPNNGWHGGEISGITARSVNFDHLYWSQLGPGDQADTFRIPLTISDPDNPDNTSSIEPGSVVRVSVSHLPADFDLVLYGRAQLSNLRSAPIGHSPIGHSPIGHSPLGDDANCLPDGGVVQPQTLQDVPILPEDSGQAVRSYSTNRSTETEVACTVVQPGDDELYAQVSGFNDATNGSGYLFDAQVSGPPEALNCPPATMTGVGTAGTLPAPTSIPSDRQTLILVNEQRIGQAFGAQAETDVVNKLTEVDNQGNAVFLDAPNVKGVVLPVDGDQDVRDAYAAWDQTPCDPAAANEVVQAINAVVDTYRPNMPNLKNIVVVGSDQLIPFARVPEIVPVGSESGAASSVVLGSEDNPTSRSLALGNILSDDWYASFDPQAFLTTQLPVPSVAIGRLVETPADITDAIDQYETFQGHLAPSTTNFTEATFGEDFMKDGAQAVENALTAGGKFAPASPNKSRIDDTWTKNDVTGAFNAQLHAVEMNAHFDQYRSLPAGPFNSPPVSPNQLFTTATFGATTAPAGTLLFTMGCHSGLSIPDVYLTGLGTTPSDPRALDWAQAVAGKQGLFDGNTGFGYGDDTTVAFSERLTQLFAQNLGPSMSVGQAMQLAKHQYLTGHPAIGGVDAKVLAEATFYGLPMYVFGQNGQVGGNTPVQNPVSTQTDGQTGLQTASFSFNNLTDPNQPISTTKGTYFKSSDGLTLAEPNRPIQPVSAPRDVTPDLTAHPGLMLKGGLITNLTVADLQNNPVFSSATFGASANSVEPRVIDGTFPSSYVLTSSQDTVFGQRDSLSVFGGKFLSDATTPGAGTETLFTSMTVLGYYSTDADTSVGTLSHVEAHDNGNSVSFIARNDAEDVARMVISYRLTNGSTYTNFDLTEDQSYSGPGSQWTGTLSTPTNVADYFVQWVMDNGTVGNSTLKGGLYSTKPVITKSIPGSPKLTTGGSTYVTAATKLRVSVSSPGAGIQSCSVSVSDGSNVVQTPSCGQGNNDFFLTGLPDGTYTISAAATDSQGNTTAPGDSGNAPLTVVLDDTAPTQSTNCPQAGPFLLHQTPAPTVTISGSDGGSGALQSSRTATVDVSSVGLKTLSFAVSDNLGNQAKPTLLCTYRVQYKFSGFTSPVDNPPTLNAANAGQTIPVKWRITDANGVGVTSAASFLDISVAPLAGAGCTGTADAIETYTDSPSGLQNLGNGNWQFNLKTPKTYATKCKAMSVLLNDGFEPNADSITAPFDQRWAKFKFK